jgi:hypothetical protein
MDKLEIAEEIPELRARFAVQDFFVDFMGGLVPGLLFLLGLTFTLMPVAFLVFTTLLERPKANLLEALDKTLQSTQETPNTIWIAGFFILVAVAYVVGHLFYRRGPKQPDLQSLLKISKGKTSEELREDFGCPSYKDAEFPYPDLHAYLKKRGQNHLLPLVKWREGSSLRSKTYINLLKIRLRYYHPEKCSEIIRNEAHVRLSSSTWFVARALRICSLTVLGLGLFVVAILVLLLSRGAYQEVVRLRSVVAVAVFPLTVWLLSEFGRSRIESILHYQRMREVFYVLETTYIAFRDSPELLNPPFEEFMAAVRRTPEKMSEEVGTVERS